MAYKPIEPSKSLRPHLTKFIENQVEARIFANFLWNERRRHLDDIKEIDAQLRQLKQLWEVEPNRRRVWVRVK